MKNVQDMILREIRETVGRRCFFKRRCPSGWLGRGRKAPQPLQNEPMKTTLLLLPAVLLLGACEKSETAAPGTEQPVTTTRTEAPALSGPEAAAREVAELQDQLATVMESVKDAASAEAAVGKLAPIADRFADVGKAVVGMDKNLSPEVDAKMKELLKPSQARLSAAMEKVIPILQQHPETAKRFEEAMAKMNPGK